MSELAVHPVAALFPMLAEAGVVLDYAPDLVEKIFAGGITRQQAAAAFAVNRALKRKGAVAPIQSL
jgi:hypothetical protein